MTYRKSGCYTRHTQQLRIWILRQNSSKPCVTRINSPTMHAWGLSLSVALTVSRLTPFLPSVALKKKKKKPEKEEGSSKGNCSSSSSRFLLCTTSEEKRGFLALAPLTSKSSPDVDNEDDDDYYATIAPPKSIWGAPVAVGAESKAEELHVVLTDFSTARLLDPDTSNQTLQVGTYN
ncbi:hypothetical protein PIB30_055971 [Stylosanthes scabra]|uniref:Uncharacterized protein n=1 Tax=Stylosanthes scabra TaxID=79078 RepID=A0ABU6TJV5_9FABA|nr:hypothetical protein [Stylosanthes scabra]